MKPTCSRGLVARTYDLDLIKPKRDTARRLKKCRADSVDSRSGDFVLD